MASCTMPDDIGTQADVMVQKIYKLVRRLYKRMKISRNDPLDSLKCLASIVRILNRTKGLLRLFLTGSNQFVECLDAIDQKDEESLDHLSDFDIGGIEISNARSLAHCAPDASASDAFPEIPLTIDYTWKPPDSDVSHGCNSTEHGDSALVTVRKIKCELEDATSTHALLDADLSNRNQIHLSHEHQNCYSSTPDSIGSLCEDDGCDRPNDVVQPCFVKLARLTQKELGQCCAHRSTSSSGSYSNSVHCKLQEGADWPETNNMTIVQGDTILNVTISCLESVTDERIEASDHLKEDPELDERQQKVSKEGYELPQEGSEWFGDTLNQRKRDLDGSDVCKQQEVAREQDKEEWKQLKEGKKQQEKEQEQLKGEWEPERGLWEEGLLDEQREQLQEAGEYLNEEQPVVEQDHSQEEEKPDQLQEEWQQLEQPVVEPERLEEGQETTSGQQKKRSDRQETELQQQEDQFEEEQDQWEEEQEQQEEKAVQLEEKTLDRQVEEWQQCEGEQEQRGEEQEHVQPEDKSIQQEDEQQKQLVVEQTHVEEEREQQEEEHEQLEEEHEQPQDEQGKNSGLQKGMDWQPGDLLKGSCWFSHRAEGSKKQQKSKQSKNLPEVLPLLFKQETALFASLPRVSENHSDSQKALSSTSVPHHGGLSVRRLSVCENTVQEQSAEKVELELLRSRMANIRRKMLSEGTSIVPTNEPAAVRTTEFLPPRASDGNNGSPRCQAVVKLENPDVLNVKSEIKATHLAEVIGIKRSTNSGEDQPSPLAIQNVKGKVIEVSVMNMAIHQRCSQDVTNDITDDINLKLNCHKIDNQILLKDLNSAPQSNVNMEEDARKEPEAPKTTSKITSNFIENVALCLPEVAHLGDKPMSKQDNLKYVAKPAFDKSSLATIAVDKRKMMVGSSNIAKVPVTMKRPAMMVSNERHKLPEAKRSKPLVDPRGGSSIKPVATAFIPPSCRVTAADASSDLVKTDRCLVSSISHMDCSLKVATHLKPTHSLGSKCLESDSAIVASVKPFTDAVICSANSGTGERVPFCESAARNEPRFRCQSTPSSAVYDYNHQSQTTLASPWVPACTKPLTELSRNRFSRRGMADSDLDEDYDSCSRNYLICRKCHIKFRDRQRLFDHIYTVHRRPAIYEREPSPYRSPRAYRSTHQRESRRPAPPYDRVRLAERTVFDRLDWQSA